MGKVRFYASDNMTYVSLRMESDGVYLEEVKHRLRKRRLSMPPRSKQALQSMENSLATLKLLDTEGLLQKICAVFADFEEAIRLDNPSMVSFKAGFKTTGLQMGVKYREQWTNYPGENFLACLLAYYDDQMAEPIPPPTPLKGGKGS